MDGTINKNIKGIQYEKILSAIIKNFLALGTIAQNKDADAIKVVLKEYNNAIEKLDVSGTEKLFTADSKIYESGGSEGNYAHYQEHHLTSELKEFKSFKLIHHLSKDDKHLLRNKYGIRAG